MKLSTLIVDDEIPARLELRYLLRAHPEIVVAGEAATLGEARAALAARAFDVVFLDLNLLGENGLDLVPDLPPGAQAIFSTADERLARAALRPSSSPYLLKPVEPAALAAAVARLRALPATA